MAYDIDFLGGGVKAPLPTFGPKLDGDIFRSSELREGIYGDYPTYSLVMNTRYRSAAFVALNIDQKHLGGKGSRSWRTDSRFKDGSESNQLNNDYYKHNVWDRGHLAKRESAAWGDSQEEKDENSKETYYWTNSTLQHEWVNKDEWKEIEDWVRNLKEDGNDKICSISGPIYSEIRMSVAPEGREPAAVPTAFFKVVMFRHRDSPDKLSVRAFIVPQNAATMRAIGDFDGEDFQTYQVAVRMIEERTGLVFPDEVKKANPLFYQDREGAAAVGNPDLPEIVEIDVDRNVIDPDQLRQSKTKGSEAIKIAAAMVNPSGSESANEWISLINLGGTTISLNNWKMLDHRGRVCELSGDIAPGVGRCIKPISKIQLTNSGGSITLVNANGAQVDRAFWIKQEAKKEDVPIVFLDPKRFDPKPKA